MTIYDIVVRLIGNIEPTGQDSIDIQRLDNLKKLGELVNRLVDDIGTIASSNKNSYENSVKELVNSANEILDEIGVKK